MKRGLERFGALGFAVAMLVVFSPAAEGRRWTCEERPTHPRCATTTTVAPTTTTTTAPATTTTTGAPTACVGTTVTPTDDVQTVLNAHPEGTTFCFDPGTYRTGFVRPRSHQRLIAITPRTVVFTGDNVRAGGIVGSGGENGQHDVTVDGLVVRDYRQDTFPSWPRSGVQMGWRWTVTDVEVTGIAHVGVTVNDGARLSRSWVHDNGRYGIAGGPTRDVEIADTDISWNNRGFYDLGDAGGTKIVGSTPGTYGVRWLRNHVHHNFGHGLWSDWAVKDVLYEGNVVEANTHIGIFHEASADARIVGNILRGNGTALVGLSVWHGGEIHLNDSKNVEIADNTIDASGNAVTLVDIDRGSTVLGTLETVNVWVHDNTITLPGQVGLVGSRAHVYEPGVNRFEANRYTTVGQRAWEWQGARTWAEWQALGHDLTGTLN